MNTRLILFGLLLGTLAACGTGARPTPPSSGVVELVLANPDVHRGSYSPVEVRIDPASGLTLADLTFEIPAGPLAGDVSLSQERDPPPTATVLLLAGPQSGSYDLVASETATGTELDRLAFRVTNRWADSDTGPCVWFTGTPRIVTIGAAWGGGPTEPQNFNAAPAMGTKPIAVILTDSSSHRYTPAEAATTKDAYLDALVRGVPTGGVTSSVKRYYEEVSYGKFTISAEAFGPFNLDGPFDSYIESGNFKDQYVEQAIEKADAAIDFRDFHDLLFVLRTDETTDPMRPVAAWPYAKYGGPFHTDDGDLIFGLISMSSTYIDASTMAHEIGHVLSLYDQYKPDIARAPPGMGSRNIGEWGLMHNNLGYPHLTAPHRMKLGWIERPWIRNMDFSRAAGPVDEDVLLEAIERGAPTGAPHNVLEIRIADGRNYYFEYRKPQPGQIGDQALPQADSVLGTDALTAFTDTWERPFLLLFENDDDGDGSVLQAGEDYREVDATDPSFPTDFRVDVLSLDDEIATLRVQYGVLSKPDPSIRPWPAGADRQYQSPDIEIRNARNAADPSLFNVPWAEHPNTIVARVKNRGTLNAESVVVSFCIKGLTTGGAEETCIGTDTNTIAPDATIEFVVPWTPPAEGHYCVVARIAPYVTPVGGIAEMTGLNNVAQSNYARFISATASPASREKTFLIVGNPFPQRARVHLVSAQTNPYYRTYIEHRYVTLDPGELRRVNVMFEHAGKFPDFGEPGGSAMPLDPNHVIIKAFVDDPRSAPIESQVPFDGVQIRIDTGRKTQTEVHGDDKGVVTGTVRTVDDGEEVSGGRVIVSYEGPEPKGRIGHQVVPVADGVFTTEVPDDWTAVHVTYLPVDGLAESDASQVR